MFSAAFAILVCDGAELGARGVNCPSATSRHHHARRRRAHRERRQQRAREPQRGATALMVMTSPILRVHASKREQLFIARVSSGSPRRHGRKIDGAVVDARASRADVRAAKAADDDDCDALARNAAPRLRGGLERELSLPALRARAFSPAHRTLRRRRLGGRAHCRARPSSTQRHDLGRERRGRACSTRGDEQLARPHRERGRRRSSARS